MGSSLTKEYPSTWNQDDVKKWKQKAKEIIKSYYLSFNGSQFDEYMIGEDENLLLAKICFAMYGPPTIQDATDLCDGYDEKQKESANEILKLILEIHSDKNKPSKRLLVGIIVVVCKQEKAEFPLPIFSVFCGCDPMNPHAARAYVDTQRRTYKSWVDWKENNTLPMLKYAFPRRGFFTCSTNCSYEFDVNKEPDIAFGTSPACNVSSRIFGTTDTVAGVTSLACGIIGIASMFTPIGPAILLTTAITGTSSAAYGTSRAVVRLYDKGSHGGSLSDLESFMLWFSIAATPLHFTTSIVNASLIRGAVNNGRIFSSSMRMFATVLNFSTLGVDGVMIAFGIANMVDKYKQDQLTSLDVLQFSMSVFFFTNTLIRPQMASSIIKNAQETHIQNYADSMTDADAQATFNRFVDSNKGDGTITDNSKIIRTINRINDPNKLFGELKSTPDIKIGGRKGKTLLVSDQNQRVNRINPNNVSFTETVQGTRTVNFKDNINKLFKRTDLKNAELNGKKIFDNLTDRQTARVNRAIGGAAGTNKLIVTTAIEISERMNLNTVDDVLSIVEIISAQLKKDNPLLKMNEMDATHLAKVNTPDFVAQIQNDYNIAMDIANRNGVQFENPLLAVYHYRKHGQEFASVINNSKIEVYLTKVPASLIQDGNLTNIETVTNPNGTTFVRKTYITPQDQFAVVIEGLDDQKISTMFLNGDAYQKHRENFSTSRCDIDLVGPIAEQFAQIFGFRGRFSIFVNFDTPEERFELDASED